MTPSEHYRITSTDCENVRSDNLWISGRRPVRDPQARLFCLPYAGGGTTIFHAWPDRLPNAVEVCPIALPGRENRIREKAFDRLPPLVEALAAAIHPYLDKPFALFGHSMGALIAFELTRYLRERRYPMPYQLVVSAARAPHCRSSTAKIHVLPDHEFTQQLRLLRGTSEAVLQNEELMQLLLPVLRADFAICEEYVYNADAPLDCPITVYAGRDDQEIGSDLLHAWSEQTRGIFRLRMFPGDHFYLLTAREKLLRAIGDDLRVSLPDYELSGD
jgi:medium-chain acyl-[acyl-carrier-protein] hydrolase